MYVVPWHLLLPFILLAAGSLAALVAEPWLLSGSRKHAVLPWILAAASAMAALAYLPQLVMDQHFILHGLLVGEPIRAALGLAVLFTAACAVAGLQHGLARDRLEGGEAYVLVGVGALGALLLVHAASSIAVFLGIELLSLPVYALVALRRERLDSQEGLLKYFLMGAVFGAVFLYGAALSYGATGSLQFGVPANDGREALFALGRLLMIAGLLFKLGAVPFHFWTPDAYSAAPLAVTGFMGAAAKLAGVAVLGTLWLDLVALDRLPGEALPMLDAIIAIDGIDPLLQRWSLLLLCLAILGILLGNFSALGQQRARRLLAYSSIAHVGYMLLAMGLPSGVMSDPRFGLGGLWVYLLGYAVALSGLMCALATTPGRDDEDGFGQLAGLARQRPFLGIAATICLASLAGFPPTVGFLGKYLVFAGLVDGGHLTLAVCAIALAVVGAVAYLRLMAVLWSPAVVNRTVAGVGPLPGLATALAAVLVLALLLLPGLLGATGGMPESVAVLGP